MISKEGTAFDIWVLFQVCVLLIACVWGISEGASEVISESTSGRISGTGFRWSAHRSLGSRLEAVSDEAEGEKYIAAEGTRSGMSVVRVNFMPERADFSSYDYLYFQAKVDEVPDLRVSFYAHPDTEDASHLFSTFTFRYEFLDEPGSEWIEFWVPVYTGSLSLMHRRALEEEGLGEQDLTAEHFKTVIRNLDRIDFTFYGEEGKALHIKKMRFTSEPPPRSEDSFMLGEDINIVGFDEMVKEEKLVFSAGGAAIETKMEGDASLEFEISGRDIPEGHKGVLILNIFDRTMNPWVRNYMDVSAHYEDKQADAGRLFLNGMINARSHFRNAVWRERVLYLCADFLREVSGDKFLVKIKANTDFSIREVDFITVESESIDSAISDWMDNCRKFSKRQLKTVVRLGLFDDGVRQYERGMFYLGQTGSVERVKDSFAEIIRKNEHMESLIDLHYYDSPAVIARGRMEEYDLSVGRINRFSEELSENISAKIDLLSNAAKSSGFELKLPDIKDIERFKESGEPFVDRTVFMMFANSRWGDEGLQDGRGGNILYETMKLCGVEGRFSIANTLDFSLRQRGDDAKYGWDSVPVLWLLHRGMNHTLSHSPKLNQLYEEFGEEMLKHTPVGPADMDSATYKRWQFPGNVFHPEYRKYVRDYARETAGVLAKDPGVMALTTVAESNFWALSKGYGRVISAGYSPLARKAFHARLREKYGTVQEMNSLWNSSYGSFDEVELPPCSRMEPDRGASGLIYEFETFRKESFADFIDMLSGSVKSAAPDKLTWAEPWNRFNGAPYHGIDYLKIFSSPNLDIVHTHHNASPFMSAYNHMFRRYLGKIISEGEFTYLNPENRRNNSCEVIYNAGLRNLWNTLAWDKRGVVFWPTHLYAISSGGYGSSFHDRNLVLPVRAAGAMRVMKEKAEHVNDVLFGTEILSGGVAILQPSTSLILEKMSFYPSNVCLSEAEALFNLLHNKGISPFIVPEEYIVDGRESLQEFSVLIVPHATFVHGELDGKLLDWVENGGTVISSGPYGIYNQYAQKNSRLITEFFGDVDFTLSDIDAIKTDQPVEVGVGALPFPAETPLTGWSYDMSFDADVADKVSILLEVEGRPGMIERSFGRGSFIISSFSLGSNLEKGGGELGKFILERVEQALKNNKGFIPVRLAEGIETGLIMRGCRSGKYIIAINQSAADYSNCVIELGGISADKIVDMTTGGGLDVPFTANEERTAFRAVIAPGEGVVFRIYE